jgi:hypothetical protein
VNIFSEIEEQIFLNKGTRILPPRNKSHLLGNKNIASQEEIMYTQGTRILCLRNKSRLLGEQEYCVQGINLPILGNTQSYSKEQKRSITGTKKVYANRKQERT